MYWDYPEEFDVIVIGGGHAGCEAALAPARMGQKVLLLTMSVDAIAKMSCNPAIGGVGKGHIVREISALGGQMADVADATGIQFRMLNRSRGPAVFSPRCQSDRWAYATEMRQVLEKQERLFIKQGTCHDLLVCENSVQGVVTQEGVAYKAPCVILCSGTFLQGLMHVGQYNVAGGRFGDAPSVGLSQALKNLGFRLERLKTGTPARIHARSIDFSLCEEQPGEEGVCFSYDKIQRKLPQVSCYITYTTDDTKKIIEKNLERSPLYSGKITGTGVRYCPSIEDKVVKFPHRDRHQIFLEPEGLTTEEVYLNGISSSLPVDVQEAFIHSIPALAKAELIRPGYAIEYDYAVSGQIKATLETHLVEGLFFAGQLNGTTGYEEAAAQGLLAGINAALKVQNKPSFVLQRHEAYIGVMIDDLMTKKLDEPYRMFTSRAEHRLLLRQDNADLRLREKGYTLGLIDEERYLAFHKKREQVNATVLQLGKTYKQLGGHGYSLAKILARPEMSYTKLQQTFADDVLPLDPLVEQQVELFVKYQGYIQMQEQWIEKKEKWEGILLPENLLYQEVVGLRNEAREKLLYHKPQTLGQASRILGVTPADISILLVFLEKRVAVAQT